MSPQSHNEYDIIFAGGGTTACIVAGRLAAADPNLRILILEAGPHTKDVDKHTQPARYLSNIKTQTNSETTWFHKAEPSPYLDGRALGIHCGRCVGGGSNVNFMMYTRASVSDYDEWEKNHHNPGWSSKDLIPLMKKSETYQVKPGEPTHGYSGPLKVSYGGLFTNVGKQCLEAALGYDKGRVAAEDSNDLSNPNGLNRDGRSEWIDGETGKRSDTAHCYIYNQEGNKNMHVLAGKVVKRVVIENGRAVGVEYTDDLITNPDGDQMTHLARASRLVVVSGGAFGSPAILERSGIGAKEVLYKHGVEQIVNLPCVGENYQDHPVTFPVFLAGNDAQTLDLIYRGDEDSITTQWKSKGNGILAHNGYDIAIKLRPNAAELKELGPGFEARWKANFEDKPDKPAVLIVPCSGFIGDHSDIPKREYIGACYYICYPSSIGRVHIGSGQDPNAPPEFHSGFLEDPRDIAAFRLAYKKVREIVRRIPLYRGEYQPRQPVFPEGSAAACKEVEGPVPIDAPDIVYTPEDDKAIEMFHRQMAGSARHSLGTCAMKPRENGGVVDPRLNVYGVERLKVVDLSIVPSNIASNTYSTAVVIGEKAAMLIAEDLGIKGV
ncbi:hypothetical protein SERLADRAFT_491425 [Serpula lacrymans var. lacrymans S7.9]|uniref:Glucose-methanol-choline oxidoreductase N-terminal domain-containing protein n=1 Tax=Serpula lacrymans var. lacrymans (strain S7.9) TaxID=578457 RepID=F8NTX7_SERL9|nr:uncharacterized protein SERLADRAFT_491425 [Serpula lacrymans var. lacrymans S7.9]EGO26056.1 hypothetical protein SERLADRAFT_491425 [Serpula lacrymans var. lacrymans S7.9]